MATGPGETQAPADAPVVVEDPPAAIEEFRTRLAQLTPRMVVTPALVALNVLVFVAMIATGVGALQPGAEDLIRWGANYGPLTTGGQPWRLATSMFVHIGVIHLLFNMWVLWDAGRLVERLLGPLAFGVAYLLAGLGGSLTSLAVHPQIVSAGASGAIFGIYGVLAAFLLRQRAAVPADVLKQLARSSLFFVGYNVMYGLGKQGIDMSAHMGGIAGGFVVGLALVHPLTPEARARARRRASAVAALGLAAVIAIVTLAVPRSVDFGAEVSALGAEMTRLGRRYNDVVGPLQEGKVSGAETARILAKELVPGARVLQLKSRQLRPSTPRDREVVRILQRSADLTEQMFVLVADAASTSRYENLEEQVSVIDKQLDQEMAKLQALPRTAGDRP